MKLIVDNLAVEYADEGAGPILLMLHGWGNTMQYFDTLCEQLKEFRTLRLDLPGFGSSEVPREPWNVERYARFVAAFCKKLNIEPKFILGHSFGGRITTKAVGANILRPEKIVLIASAGVADRKELRLKASSFVAKVGKAILSPFPSISARARRRLYDMTGSDYLKTGALADTFVLTIGENLSADAANISLPTLLVWGHNDIVTPLSEGKKLHALIVHSQLEVIPHAGHFVYREHPKEVADLIKKFLV